MEFKSVDFKDLKYNCHAVDSKKKVLDEFPELQRFPEFALPLENIDHDKVIRYVIYAYDKRSPLLSEKNLIKRKMLACKLAGFELVDNKYEASVEAMIRGHNTFITRMICRYCRNQRDLTYALMVAGLESFFDSMAKLSAPIEGTDMKEFNDRAALYTHMTKIISSLEGNANEVFNGEIELLYEADEIEQEESGKIRSYPEFIAQMREEGRLKSILKNV
jgi:hypothetical protein